MLPIALFSLLAYLHASSAEVQLSSLLPFGLAAGDSEVNTGVHIVEGPIPLRVDFPFFNKKENVTFVGTNGVLTFARPFPQFAPTTCGALEDEWRMVAPFWTDFDTNPGGAIYYRESNDPRLLQIVSREVTAAFPQLWGLNLHWLFIVTWFEGPYHGAPQPQCPGFPLNNTLQAILTTDGTYSFAVFYYNRISWTTGAWGGSDNCGRGGIPARVGFDPGDRINFYSVPESCNNSIINIASMSNLPTPSPGKFVFRIDNADSIKGCVITNGSESVPLILSPSFVNFMGNRPIILSGPCFNETTNASCTFNDPSGFNITVPAKIVNLGGVDKAICVAPFFKRTGRTRVQLTVEELNSTSTFSGALTISNEQPALNVDYSRTATEVALGFKWSPSLFEQTSNGSNAVTLSIRMIVFERSAADWKDALEVASNVSNSDGEVNATLTFGNVSWLVPEDSVSKSFVAFRIDVTDPETIDELPIVYVFKTGFSKFFCGSLFFPQSNEDREKQCVDWHSQQPMISPNQTACPPTLRQAVLDWRFEREPLNEIGGIYRPNAVYSFHSRVPQEGTGYCQQCTYNAAGNLSVGPVDGGNLHTVHPIIDPIGHWSADVVPFCDCCLEFNSTSCPLYYNKRPSHPGTGYIPPNITIVTGDPHFTTLDGVQYPFNPIGEFTLIRQELPGGARFDVQTRIEKYVAPAGSGERPLNASIFTAIVMRRTDPSQDEPKIVQVQRSLSSDLEVLVDGTLFPLQTALSTSQRVSNFAIDAAYVENSPRIRVAFDAGWAFDIWSHQGALTFTVAASEENQNTPRGLLGNFNKNPDDDLITPDGIQIPINSSLQDIHMFGMKWNVSASESLFSYPPGRNHSSFQDAAFVPSFHMPAPNELPPDVRAMCGDSRACLFDVVSTGGNLAFANNTLKQEKRVKEMQEELNTQVVLCPMLTLSPYAVLETTNGFFDGSVASVLCVGDYVLVGNGRTTCSNGIWTSALGDCVPTNNPTDTPILSTTSPTVISTTSTTISPTTSTTTSTTISTPTSRTTSISSSSTSTNTLPSTTHGRTASEAPGFNLFKPPFLFVFIGVLVLAAIVILTIVITLVVIKIKNAKVNKVAAAAEENVASAPSNSLITQANNNQINGASNFPMESLETATGKHIAPPSSNLPAENSV